MIRKNFLWTILLLNAAALGAVFFLGPGAFRGGVFSAGPALPVYGVLHDFTLIEKDGRVITLERLKGGIWVADFMFTNCPGQCPQMNRHLSGLQGSLPPEVGLASFSVDPVRDTPAVLAEYAKKYAAQETRWLFLTGAKSQINQLLSDCHFNSADDPNLHSLRFVLLDRAARVRGYYDYADEASLRKLVHDAKILLKEKL